MAIEWTTMKRGPRGSNNRAGIHMRKGTTSASGSDFVIFAIRVDVMKAMRWVIGDRLIFGYDAETGMCALRRSPDGYKLTVRNTRKGQNVEGKVASASLKIAMPETLRTSSLPFEVSLEDCGVSELGLTFFLDGKSALAPNGDRPIDRDTPLGRI